MWLASCNYYVVASTNQGGRQSALVLYLKIGNELRVFRGLVDYLRLQQSSLIAGLLAYYISPNGSS